MRRALDLFRQHRLVSKQLFRRAFAEQAVLVNSIFVFYDVVRALGWKRSTIADKAFQNLQQLCARGVVATLEDRGNRE